MKKFLFVCLLCTVSLVFANITATIDPNPVNLGDSFQLTLTIDGISTHQTPDLLPLQRDFEINSTEHRVSTTILNGHMETVNQWGVLLTPKRAGKLNIPSIHIGQEHSNVLTIDVASQGIVTSRTSPKRTHVSIPTDKRLQIQTKTNVKTPYVNQEILLTVKLIHQDQLLDANYQPPTLEDALILPLGDSEQYQRVEKNQIFTVEEQRYALFPQKPGTQVITGAHVQALIYSGMPQRAQAKGKPTLLNIKPIPKTIQAKQWLPAKAISLTEEYNSEDNTLNVGTTLIRTIKIEARALPSELLPTLKAEPSDHFGVYPEKPITKNSIHKQDVAGIKTLRITYLLNQPGTITIPSYSLTWFNTVTDKEDVSTLPERTINIIGQKEIKQTPRTHTTPTPEIKTQPKTPIDKTPWIIAFSLGVVWIFTMGAFLYYKKHPRIKKQKQSSLEELHQACQNHQPMAARIALIAWAQSISPKINMLNLDDVKKHVEDKAFKQAISNLSEILYCKNTHTRWNGDTLWSCVKNYHRKPQKQRKDTSLPTINPKS